MGPEIIDLQQREVRLRCASRGGFSTILTPFKNDTRLFDDIYGDADYQTRPSKRPRGRKRHDRPARRSSVVEPPRFPESERRRGGGRLWAALPARAAAEIPLEYDGSKFQLKAPEPNPKSRRRAALSASRCARRISTSISPARSTPSRAMRLMFDNLIRRDPRDSGKTIIPDLAQSWEIAKDGKTYTFHLRKGVEFHDGAELTSEDVKATFDRISKPPKGHQHPPQRAVPGGQRDRRARQIHRTVQARRAAAGQFHHVGDRQRLERHRPQKDAGRQ